VRVVVNGEEREVAGGTTVHGLIESLDLQPAAVAVEHNGRVLPRGDFGTTTLADGDRLEIVRFVQGGNPTI